MNPTSRALALLAKAGMLALPQRQQKHPPRWRKPRDYYAQEATILNGHRFTAYVPAGECLVNLERVERRGRHAVGFYVLVCRNPRNGFVERYSWKCAVKNGVVKIVETYPVQAWR